MKRKILKFLATGSLLILTACGQNAENQGETAPTVTSAITVAPTVTPEPAATAVPTPITDIPLTEEYFPDANFREYLYEYADTNKDRILSKEEREAVNRIQNGFADYDKSAWWNEGNADVDYYDYMSIKYLYPLCDTENLQGIEYFPNLYEIQLVGMTVNGDVTVTNPEMGVFALCYSGDAITIDLTACEKLHTCVIDCSSETKPTILLPEHLEFATLEGWDCVIGETARLWHSGLWYITPTPTVSPEEWNKQGENTPLTEEYFPDEEFRKFLSVYVDTDKDDVLTRQERNELIALSDDNGPCLRDETTYLEAGTKKDMFAQVEKIRSFEGVEYFEYLERVDLRSDSKVELLPLNNPKLEYINILAKGIKEFSIENGESLERLQFIWRGKPRENVQCIIDWSCIRNLSCLWLSGAEVDMAALAQNERLEDIDLRYCSYLWPEETLSFAKLQELKSLSLQESRQPEGVWAGTLDLSENAGLYYAGIEEGLVEQLKLPEGISD